MVVLAKDFEFAEYSKTFDDFEKHYVALGGPTGMMMISERVNARVSRIYLLLPDNGMAAHYTGFVELPEDRLPKEASLLAGRQDEFQARFSFPSRI